MNRPAGLVDLIAGVDDGRDAALRVFESPAGALGADPESISLPGRAMAIAVGSVRGSYLVDIAAACGADIVVVAGRDRRLHTPGADAGAPAVTRSTLASPAVSLATGRWSGEGEGRAELVILASDGERLAVRFPGPGGAGPRVLAAPAPEAATFNLGVDIRLPDSYVPEPNLRLALYKRISSAAGPEELTEIRAEMEDRFGKLPEPGENLFGVAALRIEAGRLGIKSVEFGEGKLSFRFHDKPAVSPDRVISFLAKQGVASLSPTGVLRIPAPPAPPARNEAARFVLEAHAS